MPNLPKLFGKRDTVFDGLLRRQATPSRMEIAARIYEGQDPRTLAEQMANRGSTNEAYIEIGRVLQSDSSRAARKWGREVAIRAEEAHAARLRGFDEHPIDGDVDGFWTHMAEGHGGPVEIARDIRARR